VGINKFLVPGFEFLVKAFMSQGWITAVWVAIAGALGALSRWGISVTGYRLFGTGFAWGTLIANVLGCFLVGFLMQYCLSSDKISDTLRLAMTVGFLGALTTFSTFSYETINYLEDGSRLLASANIAANLVIGIAATFGGLALGRTLFGGTA
jgi:CrcB protein